ncbi:MAG: hypothetical protein COT91_05420 [Candidatus Doudnabacteria bacterium CG10_big_fil_rev_8_21_14_0_10_41_10]|uniref:Aminoglycoside phosphotransferase domain-containing protein n=1 Tax=Candidatus Doudnabacteria bacterium CG10_big_fil_rev_8_21_14_0_10_41_10 TaxID=1974551 RepID=A0A2H0VC71_9BACT|nr:MAG: hypothetical protein COT91_05420 [Candidatus Doudnabacteria bacterium CG10_big_fil_rev_8_21_14_0_10_41_10]
MDPKAIVDQKNMEGFFQDHIDLFENGKKLFNLKILEHDPLFIMDKSSVLAEYHVEVENMDGAINKYFLRGSSSPGQKRQRHYQILKNLRKDTFKEEINQVADPFGYFSEYNLLIYKNIAGQSLYDKFKHKTRDEWENGIVLALDWLVEFHEKKPFKIPEMEFQWDEERRRFRVLLDGLLKRFPDHKNILEKTVAKMMVDEKEILVPESFQLIHGDFQPHNVIISDFPRRTTVIDFNDSFFYDELYDLSYFLTQTNQMLTLCNYPDNSSFLNQQGDSYLKKRSIDKSDIVIKKMKLFRLKTLMHIKSVTEIKIAKLIVNEIEKY